MRFLFPLIAMLMLMGGIAFGQSPLHNSDDPWLILGEDTALLEEGVTDDGGSYRDFVISTLAVDHLGRFFSDNWKTGDSLDVRDILADGTHVRWYGGLNEGQDFYDLLLDYTGDGYLTIDDWYGFIDDPRFNWTSYWGYAGIVVSQYSSAVELKMGNPHHNYILPFDVDGDGSEYSRDYGVINQYHYWHNRRDLLISDPWPFRELMPFVWGPVGYFDVNNDGRFNGYDVYVTRTRWIRGREAALRLLN